MNIGFIILLSFITLIIVFIVFYYVKFYFLDYNKILGERIWKLDMKSRTIKSFDKKISFSKSEKFRKEKWVKIDEYFSQKNTIYLKEKILSSLDELFLGKENIEKTFIIEQRSFLNFLFKNKILVTLKVNKTNGSNFVLLLKWSKVYSEKDKLTFEKDKLFKKVNQVQEKIIAKKNKWILFYAFSLNDLNPKEEHKLYQMLKRELFFGSDAFLENNTLYFFITNQDYFDLRNQTWLLEKNIEKWKRKKEFMFFYKESATYIFENENWNKRNFMKSLNFMKYLLIESSKKNNQKIKFKKDFLIDEKTYDSFNKFNNLLKIKLEIKNKKLKSNLSYLFPAILHKKEFKDVLNQKNNKRKLINLFLNQLKTTKNKNFLVDVTLNWLRTNIDFVKEKWKSNYIYLPKEFIFDKLLLKKLESSKINFVLKIEDLLNPNISHFINNKKIIPKFLIIEENSIKDIDKLSSNELFALSIILNFSKENNISILISSKLKKAITSIDKYLEKIYSFI